MSWTTANGRSGELTLAATLCWTSPAGVIGCVREPGSKIKYFLLCIRKPTLACNMSEFARHLLITLAVLWRDDLCRFSHGFISQEPSAKARNTVSAVRFR